LNLICHTVPYLLYYESIPRYSIVMMEVGRGSCIGSCFRQAQQRAQGHSGELTPTPPASTSVANLSVIRLSLGHSRKVQKTYVYHAWHCNLVPRKSREFKRLPSAEPHRSGGKQVQGAITEYGTVGCAAANSFDSANRRHPQACSDASPCVRRLGCTARRYCC
jgi:hypothetical protein